MPEMRKEGLPSTVNLGDVTVNQPTTQSGIQKGYRGERSDNLSLPAGAYYVDVVNVDFTGAVLLVNGNAISYNGKWHSDVRENKTTGVQDFVEAVEIQSNGTKYFLRIVYPSDHSFNPEIL